MYDLYNKKINYKPYIDNQFSKLYIIKLNFAFSLMQNYLKANLDTIGVKSTKAQNLKTIITTTDKLRNSEHIVYLFNKRESNK